MDKLFDIAIIGGGIVGTASALRLLDKKNYSILILEAEDELAAHQTGNNSGVIHSGLYYKPGSLKATNCVTGREMMYQFCSEQNLNHEKCGKIVVATTEHEIHALNLLADRGKANGLNGLRKLNRDELKENEPHVTGVAGLFVPQTGIVDYKEVVNKYAELIQLKGGIIKTGSKVNSIKKLSSETILITATDEFKAKLIVNCAGLQSDRVARLCGVNPKLKIIPFRGEYYKLKKEKEHLVRNLIYPVPDPQYPFLGVHFTRMINGGIEACPNAVLAFKREGYSKKDFSFRDVLDMKFYPGFWKMAMKHYKMGIGEFRRSFSKKLFVKSLQKLIPEVQYDDVYPEGAGVRAQALEPDGKLVDDFRIIEAKNMIHVLNAPSPAATASLSIGEKIASMIEDKFNKEAK
jgi:L-2-hydroxyglutarate oxidase